MTQESYWIEELLILSKQPESMPTGEGTVLDRCPFEHGQSFGDLIATYNSCSRANSERTFFQFIDCVEKFAPTLPAVAWDLGESNQFELFKPGRTKIILLDLNAFQGKWDRLLPLREVIYQGNKLVHLLQFSRSTNIKSVAGFFDNLPRSLVIDGGLCRTPNELSSFMNTFCLVHVKAWQGIASNPYDTPCWDRVYNEPYVHPRHGHFIKPLGDEGNLVRRVYQSYYKALPELAIQIRDVAIARSMPAEQVIYLGRAAAVQELLLTLIAEQLRPRPDCLVSVEAIRSSLFDFPVDEQVESSKLQEDCLVEISPVPSNHQPTQEQQAELQALGLEGDGVVVHRDRPELWRRLDSLQELVSTNLFTAELPAWDMKPGPYAVGFNETSFGIRIEESFSSKLDKRFVKKEEKPS